MSVISQIVAAGLEMGISLRGESVLYRTAAGQEKTITAVPLKPRSAHKMIRAGSLDASLLDWSFKFAEMIFASVSHEPEQGDQIEWTKGGQVLTYELLPESGESPVEIRDSERSQYRVHAKLIHQGDD